MSKFKFGILFLVLGLVFMFSAIFLLNTNKAEAVSTTHVLENSYLEKYDISNIPFDELMTKLDDINKSVSNDSVILNVNGQYYTYSLNEIGVSLNVESLYKSIVSNKSSDEQQNVYNFKYKVDNDKVKAFLNDLKTKVDVAPVNGTLEMGEDHILRYVNETVGFSLNVDKSYDILVKEFSKNAYYPKIDLVGDKVYTDDPLKPLNTKISSYTTYFDNTVKRKFNLIAAAGYTTGTILYPGEVFSYWQKAGPYNKPGYVAYMGVKGNGVCQVATTIYDAELLGGLETVTRYEHPDLVTYSPGGLDATVSSSPEFIADFKFKNNLSAPIYLSVYVEDNRVVAEIWSYENATNGLRYEIESVKRAYGSYDAYRHVFNAQGEEVRTDYLGRSHYYKEL